VLQFDAPMGIDVPSKGGSLAKAILEDLGFFKGRM